MSGGHVVVTDAWCCDVGCCRRTYDSELQTPGWHIPWDGPIADVQVSRPMFEVFRDNYPQFEDKGTTTVLVEYSQPVEEFFTQPQPACWYLVGERWEKVRAYQKKQGLDPFD